MVKASSTKKSASERWSLPAQQDRSRATRARLLEAAEAVFAQKGYEGARLADIAEVAGCSVGAVYFRFKDKNALFTAVTESFIEDARSALAILLAGIQMDPEELLRYFISAVAGNFRKHRGLFRAIVEHGLDQPSSMKSIFKFRDEIAVALQSALGRNRDALAVRAMTQMVYGFLIVGVLNRNAPTRIEDDRAVDSLADACIAYMRTQVRPD